MKMDRFKDIRAIAFDADDTLWALQEYFEEVEHEYCELLSEYGKEKEISAALLETESGADERLEGGRTGPVTGS